MPADVPPFSLLRRFSAGRRLSAHVRAEVKAGRPLSHVLDDETVSTAVARMPELFEDLLEDRELREDLAEARPDRTTAVIGYDGTPAARRAIERAAVVMPGAQVLVVHVWQALEPAELAFSPGQLAMLPAIVRRSQDLEAGAHTVAWARAEEGAALARALGLDARAVAARRTGSVWDTLVARAMELEADVVVIGTRARSCSQALVGGSVAHDASADRRVPVLVVPGPERVRRPARRPRLAEQEVGRIADVHPLPVPVPA